MFNGEGLAEPSVMEKPAAQGLFIPAPLPPTQKRGPEPIEETETSGKPTFAMAALPEVPKIKPEPVEDPAPPLDTETLLKVSIDPVVAEALAAEGLEIDQTEVSRLLEEEKHRKELETALAPTSTPEDLNKTFVAPRKERDNSPVTRDEFENLKESVNASFEEVASLLLEYQRQISEIEARLEAHNRRGGHKI